MKKIVPVLFALLTGAVYTFASETPGNTYLKTSHFIIRHNENITPYAAVVAEHAEAHYEKIESFLKYSLNETIKISVTDKGGISLIPEYGSIHFSPSSNFHESADVLYRQIFLRFIDSICRQTAGNFRLQTFSDLFIDMLCSYSFTGFDLHKELILRDQLKISKLNQLHIMEIDSLNGDAMKAAYAGFFYFIESSYGRKIMLRALKDSVYYGSFLNSLKSVTGKTIDEIDSEFNEFLSSKIYTAIPAGDYGILKVDFNYDHIKDFYIYNGRITILAAQNNSTEIFMIDKNSGIPSIIKLPGNLTLKSICHFENNYIAIAGDYGHVSSIIIYDIDQLRITRVIKLPGIHINTINNSVQDGVFMLNSVNGISGSIIETDYSSVIINRKNAADITGSSGIITRGESVYYIAKKDLYELIELNLLTGDEQPLLKSKDEIMSLTVSGDNIIIAANNSSGGYVSSINPVNGINKILVSGCPALYKAFVEEQTIYMLAYNNGRRKILVKELPR